MPAGDTAFRDAVEDAVRAVAGRPGRDLDPATLEALAPVVVEHLSTRYAAVWTRWQHPFAASDGNRVLYVFRDGPIPRDSPTPGPSLPVGRR